MRSRILVVCAGIALATFAAFADLDGSYVVPTDHEAIQYEKLPVSDPVAQLKQKIASGQVKLEYDDTFGYLNSVLKHLGIPVSSQVLVFSKTSFQAPRISPRMPRALYFNDEVMVGYVRGGDVLEFAAADAKQGIVFYTLDQEQVPGPKLSRQDQCLQCHASGGTLGVPGLVVRSVVPDRTGMPVFHAGTFVTDHRSPLEQRWGGWYVTGTHGGMRHMGNQVVQNKDTPEPLDKDKGANQTDLNSHFDAGAYLTPHSDIVALMVLEHQTRMQNLITRAGFEARMALHQQEIMNKALNEPPGTVTESTKRRVNSAAEEVLKYMLFTDEAKLSGEVQGTSGFGEEYSRSGVRDKQGRSLKDLDMKRRLLRYPCSPLIYTAAFQNMPDVLKSRVYTRLNEILRGEDSSPVFAKIAPEDRTAIREILLATDKSAQSYWK